MLIDKGLSCDSVERLRAMAEHASIPGMCVVLSGPSGAAVCMHGEDAAGSGQPVDSATWFQVASTGKHVTACVVLDLAARGKISLANAIGEYLPDVPPAWASRSVLSLLHHSSGI